MGYARCELPNGCHSIRAFNLFLHLLKCGDVLKDKGFAGHPIVVVPQGGDGKSQKKGLPRLIGKGSLISLVWVGLWGITLHPEQCFIDIGKELLDMALLHFIGIQTQNFLGRLIEGGNLSMGVNGQQSAIQGLNDIPIESFQLLVIVLLFDQLAPFPSELLCKMAT